MKEECIASTFWMILDFETAVILQYFSCTEIPEENSKHPVIIFNMYCRNGLGFGRLPWLPFFTHCFLLFWKSLMLVTDIWPLLIYNWLAFFRCTRQKWDSALQLRWMDFLNTMILHRIQNHQVPQVGLWLQVTLFHIKLHPTSLLMNSPTCIFFTLLGRLFFLRNCYDLVISHLTF